MFFHHQVSFDWQPVADDRFPWDVPIAIYLAKHRPRVSASSVLEQKRKIDAYLASSTVLVGFERLYFDVPLNEPGGRLGSGACRLLNDAAHGVFHDVVVERWQRLAPTPHHALAVAVRLQELGATIHDASVGELPDLNDTFANLAVMH